jgi:hypothetical protein
VRQGKPAKGLCLGIEDVIYDLGIDRSGGKKGAGVVHVSGVLVGAGGRPTTGPMLEKSVAVIDLEERQRRVGQASAVSP